MSKNFFVMNDRNDTSKGYTQVSQEYVKKYIESFTEGRAYFINLGHSVMETDEASYKAFYRDAARNKYLEKLDNQHGMVSLNAIDSDELDGVGVVVDTSEPLDEKIMRKMMIEKLPEAISILNDEEKELIQQIYFNHISEREISRRTGTPLTSVNNRKKKALKKLFAFFEKLFGTPPHFFTFKSEGGKKAYSKVH